MVKRLSESVQIVNAILCEDVRDELNNKHSILGVFSGDVMVAKFPAKIRLAAYIEAKIEKPFRDSIDIRVRLGEREVAKMTRVLDVQPGIAVLAIAQFFLPVAEDSHFGIDVSVKQNKWVEIIAKRIIAGALPSSTRTAAPTG